MNLRVLNSPEDDSLWDDFVSRHPFGTIYHTSCWRKVIEEAYRLKPFYICLEENDHRIVGGIPMFWINSRLSGKRLSAVPCAQYCNPLVRNQQEYDEILSFLMHIIQKTNDRVVEIRTSSDFTMNTNNFGISFENYCTYRLNLEKPLEDIRNSLHKSCIQRVLKNKAYSNGLELYRAKSKKDLQSFYLLYLSMRKRVRRLPQPYKFFAALWHNLFKKDMDILLCKNNGASVGTILLLYSGDTVIYEYGASRPDMLKKGVSQFLLWEAIKEAHNRGYKNFDFGRTSNVNYGLNDFKTRWGTQKVLLSYYAIPKTPNAIPINQNAGLNNLMRFAMTLLPKFTCRVIGRTLCRYLV